MKWKRIVEEERTLSGLGTPTVYWAEKGKNTASLVGLPGGGYRGRLTTGNLAKRRDVVFSDKPGFEDFIKRIRWR